MSQALAPFQTAYLIEDNFDDSSLHSRWTDSSTGGGTAVEGSDGIVLTIAASSGDIAQIDMDLPSSMSQRNWLTQCHVTLTYTGSPGSGAAIEHKITGKGAGAGKYQSCYIGRYSGTSSIFYMQDASQSDGKTLSSGASELWMRMRKFDNEVRCDYYEGSSSVEIDSDGYWVEHDSNKTWYVAPKSGTPDYPTFYEKFVFTLSHWDAQPGVTVTIRKFKLKIF